MARVFVDGGSHLGEGFEHFRTIYSTSDYKYLLFEPNPFCYQKLVDKYSITPNVELINKAIFTHNNTQPMYVDPKAKVANVSESDGFSVGCSLISKHNNRYYQPKAFVDVQCIDVLDLLKQLRNATYTEIVLKLDVEGAEYDILERCLQHPNGFDQVTKLIVEFHSQYTQDGSTVQREKDIIQAIRQRGIPLQIWH